MLIDLHTAVAQGWADAADVCIVGAGPAGISLARRLLGEGRKVLLLESGGIDYEPATAALNAGSSEGLPYYDLEDARLRLFGGTAAIWGGRSVELDDIDFEPREWVRYSGWPFRKEALLHYYGEARRELGLGRGWPADALWKTLRVKPPAFGQGVLDTGFWQFDDHWDRFGFAANRHWLDHPDLSLVLHAAVTGIELNASGAAVESLTVRSLHGHCVSVRAKAFVLAAGGIENPRLLLASRSRMACGVGNEHDRVGRFFMEHPHARAGCLHVHALWDTLQTFRASHRLDHERYSAYLRPAEHLQRARAILNSSFVPRVRPHPQARQELAMRLYQTIKSRAAPTQQTRRLWRAVRSSGRWLQQLSDPLRPWLAVQTQRKGLYLSVRAEQAPNPDSRIRLLDERDALGMPRVALDWRLSEIDKRTLAVMVGELDAQMRRDGSGRVAPADWLAQPEVMWEHDPLIGAHPIGGYHHMGTTRMASDPRFGVVDAQCRVHGVANLYMAGSSVFPTSGWANPTLTIVALSLRLGDHLRQALAQMPVAESRVGLARRIGHSA